MGRARKRRNKDKNFAEKRKARENKWDENAPRHYKEIVKENAEFETFYKMQGIVREAEWPAFMASMRESLPTAFRITGSRSEAHALLEVVKGQFLKDCLNPDNGDATSDTATEDAATKIQPFCLPWYPDELAWQLQLTRKDIRSSESYFHLHNFLISETSCGNISRQEAVSMIPPVVLDVKSHHKVLDLCAAPGSKTAQLIEALHANTDQMPTGVVIANDVDNNRCYMLVHQAKRLNSPCSVITNHDAAVMPNFHVVNPDGTRGAMKFDRVLCDVPCSGDGTLRKNPDIWHKWNSANGSNLHGVQARILRRGMEMLEVGGRLVYSTCSMNPVENEAVVHRLLVEAAGSARLVDVTAQLPGLKHDSGLHHWLPASRDLVGYESFELVPEKWRTQVRPSMFPPAVADRDKFNLQYCIRVLPHQQDTGAFFVAVLEKTASLPWEAAAKAGQSGDTPSTVDQSADQSPDMDPSADPTPDMDQSEDPTPVVDQSENTEKSNGQAGDSTPWGPQRKKRRIQGYKEDPFVFLTDTEPVWPDIRDFYDVAPALQPSCLLTRCKESKKKNLYLTSPAVRDIVVNNAQHIKFINTGVKAFVRCDNKSAEGAGCAFRLAQEGLQSVLPFLGSRRRLQVTRDDLQLVLTNNDPKCPPEVTTLSDTTQLRVADITQGSCVLEYRQEGPPDGSTEPLALNMVGWRGKRSVRAYIPVNDAVHCLRLIGADVSKFVKNKFQARPTTDGDVGQCDDTKNEDDSTEEAAEDVESADKKQKLDE